MGSDQCFTDATLRSRASLRSTRRQRQPTQEVAQVVRQGERLKPNLPCRAAAEALGRICDSRALEPLTRPASSQARVEKRLTPPISPGKAVWLVANG